jgi:High potential iron-sulfur protein
MAHADDLSRRDLLRALAVGISVISLPATRTRAADAPLLSESDPAAKAYQYVEDAKRAKEAKPGNTCANCSLYAGDSGSTQGGCSLFGDKQVKAAGWCSAWTNL